MKIKNKYVVIVLLSLTFIFLCSFYFITSDNRRLTFIEKSIKEVTLFTEKTLYAPIKFIDDKISEYKEMKELYKKLKKTNNKIKQYDLLETTLEEKNNKIKELESTIDVKNNLNEYESIAATVINRNVGYFYELLTIDKGKRNNVDYNDAVITSDGLVGRVNNTTSTTASIKLITTVNENFQISVNILSGDKIIYGLLSNYKNNQFIIEGIADNSEIEKNAKVVTTGLDNNFPSGILIGYVDRIEKDNFDLARAIYVNPSANFGNINYVLVLKRNDIK